MPSGMKNCYDACGCMMLGIQHGCSLVLPSSASSSALSPGAGDFHQLPPVAKGREAAAARKFAFEAASWRQCIHHCAQLTKVFRQVQPCAHNTLIASSCVVTVSMYRSVACHGGTACVCVCVCMCVCVYVCVCVCSFQTMSTQYRYVLQSKMVTQSYSVWAIEF